AGRAGVLVDLEGSAIHQPDVGAIGGNTGERCRATQTAGRPGAEAHAAVVVDVYSLVAIHDPNLVSCSGGCNSSLICIVIARRAETVHQAYLLRGGAAAIFESSRSGAVAIDHVKLGHPIEDAARSLAACNRGIHRAGQVEGEGLGRPSRKDSRNWDVDRL